MKNNKNILNLKGPILIIGASGFIGSNLLRSILSLREDVFGTFYSSKTYRLDGIDKKYIYHLNINNKDQIKEIIDKIRPKTIFQCSSYGAYSFEDEYEKILNVNVVGLNNILECISTKDISAFINSGTSSEYGLNCSSPNETDKLAPNSHYALSKVSASYLINYYGKQKLIPAINLRLYSVYGPYEDASRLIPTICFNSIKKKLPKFGSPLISRDFVHIDDVLSAFILAAIKMNVDIYGESFNIGTGIKTTLKDIAELSKRIFKVRDKITYSSKSNRSWDLNDWYANNNKAKKILGWNYSIELEDGLFQTQQWWKKNLINYNFKNLTKFQNTINRNSITAIIACYKDEMSINEMYRRLMKVFQKIGVEYEIIFVNDCSPDNSEYIIKKISTNDPNVLGITHSRNFGSQAAFRSGMKYSTKNSCVLLDGDLQDPPELIEDFYKQWINGSDVIYGVRVKREMSFFMEFFYKLFYFLFDKLSDFSIPKNAGDFSLIDRKVVNHILTMTEKDFFIRGLRAYIGFNQVGVDYIRPDRKYGKSTNNFVKNIGWAKRGIFSFTKFPLHLLTILGFLTLLFTVILTCIVIYLRLSSPGKVLPGITFVSLLTMGFGSIIILSVGILGEYIGKIFDETKNRPYAIEKNIIRNGSIDEVIR